MLSPLQNQVLQALLKFPTYERAAKEAGVSPQTVRTYLKQEEFSKAYQDATHEAIIQIQQKLLENSGSIVDKLARLALADDIPYTVQNQACRDLLNFGCKYTALLSEVYPEHNEVSAEIADPLSIAFLSFEQGEL